MINLEKIKLGKCQPPTPFNKTCPCTMLPPRFSIFRFYPLPTSEGGNQKLLSPFKNGAGVRTIPHRNFVHILYKKVVHKMYTNDVYKIYTKFIPYFDKLLYTKFKKLRQLNFVYKMHRECCRNVVNILYTNILHTFCIQIFCIHFV